VRPNDAGKGEFFRLSPSVEIGRPWVARRPSSGAQAARNSRLHFVVLQAAGESGVDQGAAGLVVGEVAATDELSQGEGRSIERVVPAARRGSADPPELARKRGAGPRPSIVPSDDVSGGRRRRPEGGAGQVKEPNLGARPGTESPPTDSFRRDGGWGV
jgi:hypothetical protein